MSDNVEITLMVGRDRDGPEYVQRRIVLDATLDPSLDIAAELESMIENIKRDMANKIKQQAERPSQ